MQNHKGGYNSIQQPVSQELIEEHLQHKLTLACYPVVGDKCILGCIDIDYDKSVEFTDEAQKECSKLASDLAGVLEDIGIRRQQVYGESSGRRGIHMWIFFDAPVLASQVRSVLKHCIDQLKKEIKLPEHFDIEYFPKQDQVPEEGLGNCIKVPFGIHQVTKKPTYLYDYNGNRLDAENLHLNTIGTGQWQRILRTVRIVPEAANLPVIEKDITQLFNKCEFIKEWYNKPDKIPYNTWLGIGTIFYQFGDEGKQAWRDMSERDRNGWDEKAFEKKIIELERLHPYSCRKLGCTKNCQVGSPLRHLQNPYIKVDTPVPETTELVPLDQIRHMYEEAYKSILDDYTNSVSLINAFPGLGKTYILATSIKQSEYSATWMAPTHEQAIQVMEIWGEEAVHLKSRQLMCEEGELKCPHLDEIDTAYKNGLPARAMYCTEMTCEEYETCAYLNNFARAKSARLVVVMHQHSIYGTTEMLDNEILVIDENPAPCLRKTVCVRKIDLDYSRIIAQFIQNDRLKNNILSALQSIENTGKLPEDLDLKMGRDELRKLKSNVAFASKIVNNYGDARWILDDISYLLNKGETLIKQKKQYWYSRQSWLPTDRPVFVLDATLKLEGLRMLLPDHNVLTVPVTHQAPQQCEVTHVYGATYGISSLVNKARKIIMPAAKQLIASIERMFGRDIGIIASKDLVKTAGLENKFEKVGWFGNTRGLNKFNDCEVLIVLGFWMKPIDVMVKEAYEQHGILKFDEEKIIKQCIDDFKTKRYVSLTALDGTEYQARVYKFTDPYVDNYFQYTITAELSQAIGRARIHIPTDVPKQVWIITNVMPTHVQATHAISKNELVTDLRVFENIALIKKAIECGADATSPKSIKETLIKRGHKISLSTVKRHYKKIDTDKAV